VWFPIVGYEGRYEISDLSRVRSIGRSSKKRKHISGRILSQHKNKQGHLQLRLLGKIKTIRFLCELTFKPVVLDPDAFIPVGFISNRVHDLIVKFTRMKAKNPERYN